MYFQTSIGEVYFFDERGISLIYEEFDSSEEDLENKWLLADAPEVRWLETLYRRMAIMASSPLKDNFKLYQKQFAEGNTVYFPEWSLQEVDKFRYVHPGTAKSS